MTLIPTVRVVNPAARTEFMIINESDLSEEHELWTEKGADVVGIPDDWRSLSWQIRRSIASKISTTPIRNADEADAAIAAELERRGS